MFEYLAGYLLGVGFSLVLFAVTAGIAERMKKLGKSVEEALAGLPEQVLAFLIPFASWLTALFYFRTLTVDRVMYGLHSGNIMDMIASLTFILSVVILFLAVVYFIRALIPSLIAVSGFLLGFFSVLIAIYGLITGQPLNLFGLIFGVFVLFASYVMGRAKLRLKK